VDPYQITQHHRPLATGGWLGYSSAKGGEERVRIRRIHLEEDSGRSLHDRVPGATAIDLNRAGVPLIEIVTEPDLRSPEDARAMLGRLKQALEYLEVSDCSMERGSLRVDANVSLRGPDGAPGPRSEIKNLNSFGNLERALRFEIRRQRRLASAGERVESWTLLWDAARRQAEGLGATRALGDFSVGQVMRRAGGAADPQMVASLLRRSLAG
jgi:aspartyl-tRNA(Asn)/glutamyl-tRNA(Gln) amidotransferase subunit B